MEGSGVGPMAVGEWGVLDLNWPAVARRWGAVRTWRLRVGIRATAAVAAMRIPTAVGPPHRSSSRPAMRENRGIVEYAANWVVAWTRPLRSGGVRWIR